MNRSPLITTQIGKIRSPAFSTSHPPEDHPLIKIFDAAVAPLAELLISFPDDHPVVSSYNSFFEDRPADARDTGVEEWLGFGFGLEEPVRELTALMEHPLEKLQDFRLVSVPGPERRRRVIGVGRAMLQLLALQHELQEPLNLNGDIFEDLIQEAITPREMESSEALRAMFIATNPKQLDHKKYWDMEALGESLMNFRNDHTIFDSTFRPPTYFRIGPRESRRPRIAIEIPTSAAKRAFEDTSRGKIRHRTEDGDEDDDVPPAKRQATPPHKLRPRGKNPRAEKRAAVVPKAEKVLASGRGWYTIAVDSSD